MSPFWKQSSLLRRGDQSVHPAPDKSPLLDCGGAKAEEEHKEKEEEEAAAVAFDWRRHGGVGLRSMLKKLLSIGGGGERKARRKKKGAHLAVYIGEELRRFEVPIEYFRYDGFAKLLLECRDADALDFNINLPIEIDSCSVERFHMIWRGAVEEEEEIRRGRRWRL